MRTIHKQGQYVGGERIAAVTVRQTLRSLGVKEFADDLGNWRNRMPVLSAAYRETMPLLDCIEAPAGLELQSSNDVMTGSIPGEAEVFPSITLLEHSSAIAYVSSCQPDSRLIYVSPQISNLGFSAEELLDQPDLRLKQVHEEDFDLLDQALKRSYSTAEKFSCQYRLYDNQGEVRWFHDEASVICDEAGTPLLIKGVMLDITDKKRMEAELVNHRYYLERNVEQRTRQLMKRIAMFESCNDSLCSELSSARMEIAALKQQLVLLSPPSDESNSSEKCSHSPG